MTDTIADEQSRWGSSGFPANRMLPRAEFSRTHRIEG